MQSYRIVVVISIILAIVIIALYLQFFVIKKGTDFEKPIPEAHPKDDPSQLDKTSSKKAEKSLPLLSDIPSLNDSDDFVRRALKGSSPIPEFQTWLKENDIIRRFVAVVDNLINGESPASNLKFLKSEKKFQVIKNKQKLILSPDNYSRYQRVISVLESLETGALIDLYQSTEPLFDEAYQKLGYPAENFRPALFRAVDIVLSIPVLKPPVFLQKQVITYAYEAQELENLNPAQKLILRLGPENLGIIKKKCREISAALQARIK